MRNTITCPTCGYTAAVVGGTIGLKDPFEFARACKERKLSDVHPAQCPAFSQALEKPARR